MKSLLFLLVPLIFNIVKFTASAAVAPNVNSAAIAAKLESPYQPVFFNREARTGTLPKQERSSVDSVPTAASIVTGDTDGTDGTEESGGPEPTGDPTENTDDPNPDVETEEPSPEPTSPPDKETTAEAGGTAAIVTKQLLGIVAGLLGIAIRQMM